ncbi:MAG: hypothetical protein QM621_02260 [Aeromicrobium sp.]|uniref:hypothetical protein n=1 Tax=Aeromicrobium sp. TaxID=1871063 RepID=UPI0039E5E259
MSTERSELHELIDALPDDQVASVLADVRLRLVRPSKRERSWPPEFFGIGESQDGRTDNARRVDEILAEGFGASRS